MHLARLLGGLIVEIQKSRTVYKAMEQTVRLSGMLNFLFTGYCHKQDLQ